MSSTEERLDYAIIVKSVVVDHVRISTPSLIILCLNFLVEGLMIRFKKTQLKISPE